MRIRQCTPPAHSAASLEGLAFFTRFCFQLASMSPSRRSEAMKPTTKPKRTAEERSEEEAVRRQHAANPVRQRPAGAINRQSFAAILSLVARYKAVRESLGLTLAEVAERMEIDAPALSRLESGKMLNATLATLHKWADAL